MFVLSSPSGAGKTTLSRMLLAAEPHLQLSISVTTRPRRPNELDGADYHFAAPEAFAAMREAGEFLEWAEVFGNYYGTPRAAVEAALGSERDVMFDIDWQGARQLKAQAPADIVSVFILPPSRAILAARLQSRGADSAEAMARRMGEASAEIGHWREYDYVVVNDGLEVCAGQIRSILAAERLRRERNPAIAALADELIENG